MLPLAIRLPLLRFSRLSVGPVLIILAFRALIAHVAPVVVLLLVLAPHCLALRMKLQALAAAAMAQASMASPILLVILVKRASAWALPVVARVVVVVVVLVLVLVLEYWSEGWDTSGIRREFPLFIRCIRCHQPHTGQTDLFGTGGAALLFLALVFQSCSESSSSMVLSSTSSSLSLSRVMCW
jgi:hypothetical protein